MAIVWNVTQERLPLTRGYIEPDEQRNVDVTQPAEASFISDGALVVVDGSADPPAPTTKTVPVVTTVAFTDPSRQVTLDIPSEATDAELAAAIAAIGGRFRGAYTSLSTGAAVKANDVVTNPSGALVSRIADGTISGSYNSANWTALSAGGSGLPAGGTTGQVLKKNSGTDGDAGWATAAAAGLTPTAVKTANYTAAPGDLVLVDTTSGPVTVTLPAAAAGTPVGVKLVTQGGTNAVTIAAAGSDVFNKAGGPTTLTLSLLNQGVVLAGKPSVWAVQADDLPLSQLDARFRPTVLPWATGTAYKAGQPVTNGSKTWLAVDDHTAGATFSGDSAHWTLLPVSGLPVSPAAVPSALRLAGPLDDGVLRDWSASAPSATNAASPQTTPTYEGSGQIAELDVLYVPEGWNGWKYWMVNAPYPNGDQGRENPSMLVSNDGATWQVPAGLTNPIVAQPAGGFNADPSIFLDVDGTMYIYFVTNNGTTFSVKWMKSTNGVTWTTPATLFSGGSTYNGDCPTVTYDGSQYRMYYHWAPPSGTIGIYYTTASSPTGFSAPTTPTSLTTGWSHFNMRYWNDQYYILASTGTSLRYGTSRDGVTFTMTASPVLALGSGSAWDNTAVYRGAFVMVQTASGAALDIWYAGWNASSVARVGYTRMALSSRVSALSLPGATAATRYVGATTAGAPTSGTFSTGDFAIDQTGKVWVCTAGGSPGTWAQVGAGASSATPNVWIPSDNSFITATQDPFLATGTYGMTAGIIRTARLAVRNAATVTRLLAMMSAGSGLTGAFGLLYKLDGTLIARTADQSTAWTSTGLKAMTLTAEPGQSLNLPAADVIGALMVTTATSTPQVYGSTSAQDSVTPNRNLTSPAYRGAYNTGVAAVPSPLSGLNPDGHAIWLALE